jgi:hypothetical protein
MTTANLRNAEMTAGLRSSIVRDKSKPANIKANDS